MPDNTDLAGAFNNFRTSLPGIYLFLNTFCYVAASYFTVMGLFTFKDVGNPSSSSRGSPRKPISMLITGGALMLFPSLLLSSGVTIFCNGDSMCLSNSSPLDYSSESAAGGNYLVGVRQFVQLVGVVAFLRGIFVLKDVGSNGSGQGRSVKKGVSLIVAGICAVNILEFLTMVSMTFGFTIVRTWLQNMT